MSSCHVGKITGSTNSGVHFGRVRVSTGLSPLFILSGPYISTSVLRKAGSKKKVRKCLASIWQLAI